MHHPTDRIIHTTAFVTPVVEHWLEREPSEILVLMKLVNIRTRFLVFTVLLSLFLFCLFACFCIVYLFLFIFCVFLLGFFCLLLFVCLFVVVFSFF